jgi:predicted hydrocarbon binding protein
VKGYVSADESRDSPGADIPNSVLRDLLQFLEQQLGRDTLRGVINLAGVETYHRGLPPNNMRLEAPAADYVALLQGLRDYYDERGALAFMRELGRATVRRAVIHSVGQAEQRGPLNGKQLLAIALDSFAKSTAIRDRRQVLLQDSGDMLLVSTRESPCWARDRRGHACEIVTGALRGALELVSGRELRVRSIACCHHGAHHCVFEVSRGNRWR